MILLVADGSLTPQMTTTLSGYPMRMGLRMIPSVRWLLLMLCLKGVTMARASMIGAGDILTRWEAMVEGSHSGYRVIIPNHITVLVMVLQ